MIQDERLLKVLTSLTDTINSTHNGKWVLQIHFDKTYVRSIHPQSMPAPGAIEFDLTKKSLDIDLVFFAFATTGISSVPTAYTVINNVPCFIFTGIEPLMENAQQTIVEKLRRKFKKRIVNGFGLSHAWKVNLKNDSLTIQSRHTER